MDLFKRTNVKNVTGYDYNVKGIHKLRNRSTYGRILRKQARQQLKQQDKKLLAFCQ